MWRGRGINWLFIIVLLLFAAALRLTGITFGQPDPAYNRTLEPMLHLQTVLHPDEYFYIAIPYEMAVRGWLNPRFYENPSLMIYLNYMTFRLTNSHQDAQLERWAELSNRSYAPFSLYVIGRVFSAWVGLLVVATGYGATRLLVGRTAAFCVGLLAAVSFPLVQHAHYATTSSFAAGWSALCLWACVVCLITANKNKKNDVRASYFLLAGIAAGLATGSRYNASAVSIVVFLTGCMVLFQRRTWFTAAVVMMGYLAFPITFIITTPGVLFDFATFREQFLFIYSRYTSSTDVRLMGLFYEYRYILIFGVGVLGMLLALFKILQVFRLTFRRHRSLKQDSPTVWMTWLLLGFIVPYSLWVLTTSVPEISDQLTLPVLPAWFLLMGMGFGALSERKYSALLMLLVVIFPLLLTLQMVFYFAQPDTRLDMQQKIYQYLPKNSQVLLAGAYNVPLDTADYGVNQVFDYPSIEDIRAHSVDYVLVSDAVAFFRARATADYGYQPLRDYSAAFQPVLSVARPVLWGGEWLPNNFVYWHHPGLVLYCVNETLCGEDVSH